MSGREGRGGTKSWCFVDCTTAMPRDVTFNRDADKTGRPESMLESGPASSQAWREGKRPVKSIYSLESA